MKKTAIERLSRKATAFFLAFLLACPVMAPAKALAAEDATGGEIVAAASAEPEGQGSSASESEVSPSGQTPAVEESETPEPLGNEPEQGSFEDQPTESGAGHEGDSATPDTTGLLSDADEGSDAPADGSGADQGVKVGEEASTSVVIEEDSLISGAAIPLSADESLVMPLAEGDYVAPLGGSAAELSEGTYYVSANVSMMTPMGIRGYATNPANPEGLNGSMGVPGAPVTNRSKLVVAADGAATLTVNLLNPVFTVQKVGSSREIEVLETTTCGLELHPESSLSSSEKAEYNADMASLGMTSRIGQLTLKLNNLSGQYQLADCVEFATTLRKEFTIPLDVTVDLANARRVATGDTYTKEFDDPSSGLIFAVTVENGSSVYGDVSEAMLKVSKLEESTNRGIAALLKNHFSGQPACESYAVALLLGGQELALDEKVHVAVKDHDAHAILYGFDGNNLNELQGEDGSASYSVSLPNTIVSVKEIEGASRFPRAYARQDAATGVSTYLLTNGLAEARTCVEDGVDPDNPEDVESILNTFYDNLYATFFETIAGSATPEDAPKEIADLVLPDTGDWEVQGVYAMAMAAVLSVDEEPFGGAINVIQMGLPKSLTLGPSQKDLSYRASVPAEGSSVRVLLVEGSLDNLSSASVKEVPADKVGQNVFFDLFQRDETLISYQPSFETSLLHGAYYLNGNSDWLYGSKDVAFFVVVSEKPKSIEKPVAVEGLTYNGSEQVGVAAGEGYDLSLQSAATEPGTYTAMATLKDGYVWADGSTSPVIISWSIAAAPKPVDPAPSDKLAPGTYTATANLFVPGAVNDIIKGLTAYMTNPKNPLVAASDPNYGLPTSPVADNAKLVVTDDGRYLLDLSLPNPAFTLIDFGTATGGVKVLGVQRDGKVYGANAFGRITRAVIEVPATETSSAVFERSHVYAAPLQMDKYWNVSLNVDAASAKRVSNSTAIDIPNAGNQGANNGNAGNNGGSGNNGGGNAGNNSSGNRPVVTVPGANGSSAGANTTVTGNKGQLSGMVAGSAAAATATKLSQGTYTVTCNIWFDKETTGLPLNPHITSGAFPPKDPVSNNAKLRVDANGRCTVTVPITIQHKVMKVNSISGLSVVDSVSSDGALSSITVDLGVLSPRDTVVRKSCTVGITMGDLAGTISGITGSKSWAATFQLNFAGVPASGGGTIPAAALAAMAGSDGVSDTQDAANAALAALADGTATAEGSPVATAMNEDGTPLAASLGSEGGAPADGLAAAAIERELAANPWMAFALGALCTLVVGAAAWGGRRYYLARAASRESAEVQT